MSVIFETQKSIYTKLTSNAPLMAKIEAVYDHVPDNAEYPYVTMGDCSLKDNSVKAGAGYEIELVTYVYSRATGRKEVLEIIDLLVGLLDGQSLAINGYLHIMTKLVSIDTELQKDGITRSGKILFKIYVR